MSSRQDPTSKRFSRLLSEQKLIRSLLVGPLYAGIDAETLSRLDDPIVYCGVSLTALTLDEANPRDIQILRAFKVAGLDHRNPLHWRELLEVFAEAHFGKKKTKPVKWDSRKFYSLSKDYLNVKRDHPEILDFEVCKLLMRDKVYKDKYGAYNLHALRKLVRHARSAKHNLYLRHPEMRDPLLQEIRDGFERRNKPWDEVLGKQMADALRNLTSRRNATTKGQSSK
jgi:hypothetical protein